MVDVVPAADDVRVAGDHHIVADRKPSTGIQQAARPDGGAMPDRQVLDAPQGRATHDGRVLADYRAEQAKVALANGMERYIGDHAVVEHRSQIDSRPLVGTKAWPHV